MHPERQQGARRAAPGALIEPSGRNGTPRNGSPGTASPAAWTIADAIELYGLDDWGKGYFGVGADGSVLVMPQKNPARSINLRELIDGLERRSITAPVLLRFDDILRHRLNEIRSAFDDAIRDNDYRGKYHCVYPIKVNQQRHVCELIRDEASRLGFGFEAGSKPELLAVLGLTENRGDMPIVCNGFKDDEYIETVILAAKLGRNIIPVVERFHELELLIKHAVGHGLRPRMGLRVKPSTRGSGKWESSGGARSKFGLSASETLRALDLLKQHGMADCLQMLHFHIGSQLCDVRKLKGAVTELAHFYTELSRLGAGLRMIDVGGGLGVDYDGSHSATDASINYTVTEYAADVVHRIKSACDDAKLPHPDILSESGRAMVAYASVLVVDVLGKTDFSAEPDIARIMALAADDPDTPQPVYDLINTYSDLARLDPTEAFHDALQARDEALSLFGLGYLSLPLRAAVERLFHGICGQLLARVQGEGGDEADLAPLNDTLSDIYFCNFSLFQSLPDWWAIHHLFPVCPIHRLNERPTRRGVLVDMTCDSDGIIDRFAHPGGAKQALDLHEPVAGDTYYLGFFLTGAYQEVLGDLHNLFGDTHAVHVSLDDEGRWSIEEVVEGDSVKEVLAYVQFDAEDLRRAMRRDVERAVKAGTLEVADGQKLLRFYEQGLEGYTYLE